PVNQVELGPTDTLDQRPEVSIRTVRKKRSHIDLGRHVPAFGLDPSRHRRRALDRAGCGPASTLLLLALLPVLREIDHNSHRGTLVSTWPAWCSNYPTGPGPSDERGDQQEAGSQHESP